MTSDINSNRLEKHLKALGQTIRIDILKKLDGSEHSISFSTLQKDILQDSPGKVNLSFHLKILKSITSITSTGGGYSITPLGRQMLKSILMMEQVLNDQDKTIMIRTSKYSKEPFNIMKVEEYLIKEGEMEEFSARRMAQEVEARLAETSIEYLTAPLIREYVNVILVENGLEEVRHRLTRLGTPPYEVSKLFKNSQVHPESFIRRLGSDVSEQFLLLNLLPNDLADMYLSGAIFLLNLDYWALRPLGMYLKTDSLIEFCTGKHSAELNSHEDVNSITKIILNFIDVLSHLQNHVSHDVLIGGFNKSLLSIINKFKESEKKHLLDTLISQLSRLNRRHIGLNSTISLDFSYHDNPELDNTPSEQLELDELFLNEIIKYKQFNGYHANYFFLIDHALLDSKIQEPGQCQDLIGNIKNNTIFYDGNGLQLINPSAIKINAIIKYGEVSNVNKIILDKILLNLNLIATEANQNDDKFYDLIQDKVKTIFKLFKYKKAFVSKKLGENKEWKWVQNNFFNHGKENWLANALQSISFYGLNEAIKVHCGIELDRVQSSERFALNILNLMKDLIHEKDLSATGNYLLSQPCHGDCFNGKNLNEFNKLSNQLDASSFALIRQDSKLHINKKLILHKKFEDIIDGGTLFKGKMDIGDANFIDDLKTILTSNVSGFSL